MPRAINGKGGQGEVVVYTLSPHEAFQLQTVTFKLAVGAGGDSTPEVLLRTQDGSTIARIPDWNDIPAGATVTYTFGVGLTPFCGVTSDGQSVQNDLPLTALTEGCTVAIRSVDSTGVVVAGDVVSRVLLWVEDQTPQGAGLAVEVPPYTALPVA